MVKLVRDLGIFAVVSVLGVAPAMAQAVNDGTPVAADSAAAPADGNAAKGDTEETGPKIPWQPGPKLIDLGHGSKLDLPESHVYLGMPDAAKLMEKMGNLHNDGLLGLVASKIEADQYLVTLRYEESGYIKDDEKLDGEELLDSIREGEDDYNDERKKLGFSAIHADGWDEQPHYDKQKHQLIWGLIIRDDEGASINYNTRILGRSGFVSLNLLTDKQHLAEYKPAGAMLLGRTQFESGQRYEDFNSSTDKVAEYGLTGLVLGGAGMGLAKAAKIGLLAKFGKGIIALLIAGKKAVIALFIAIGAGIKGLLGRKKNEPAA
jgi:uncharacterized membrane-anchored protein